MANADTIRNKAKYRRGWVGGRPQTECGFGSRVEQTVIQRACLAEWAKKYNIKTVNDIGAGDLNWIKLVDWDVEYQGYDLVPRHESVIQFDITQEVPPPADMLLCIWVLNHFPENEAFVAWTNLLKSASKIIVMTWDSRLWDWLSGDMVETIEWSLNYDMTEEIQIRPANPGKHEGVFLRLLKLC